MIVQLDRKYYSYNFACWLRRNMRMEIRKLLIKYNYPPNKSEQAVQTVIKQAELNCKNMVE